MPHYSSTAPVAIALLAVLKCMLSVSSLVPLEVLPGCPGRKVVPLTPCSRSSDDRWQSFLTTSFTIHYFLFTLLFDVVRSELPTPSTVILMLEPDPVQPSNAF
jgi:hypothetical protein